MSDSITWRVFCRIPLDVPVPHPTTLMKLTTRCGTAAVDGLNEALLAKAAEAKLLRTNRLRADTTVVPANVAYPTDSGLLAKAVRRIAATSQRIQAGPVIARTRHGVGERFHHARRSKRSVLLIERLRDRGDPGVADAGTGIGCGTSLGPYLTHKGSNTQDETGIYDTNF